MMNGWYKHPELTPWLRDYQLQYPEKWLYPNGAPDLTVRKKRICNFVWPCEKPNTQKFVHVFTRDMRIFMDFLATLDCQRTN